MTRKILFLIFILAFILRFYKLGVNPPSLDWDEASLGYNAYSILKTARDEYGNFLPLSIRSFNDYKPPLYTYLTTIPVFLFDLNEFSTRFISAFLGTLTVIVSYLLIRQLIPEESEFFYLLFTFIFAISPWHIQFSRVAFEANTALFFMILGIYFFLRGNKSGNNYLSSMLSFGLSLYSYHSPRLIVPILIFGLLVIYRKTLKHHLRWIIISLSIFTLLSIPIINELRSTTSARFGSVTILNDNEILGSSLKDLNYDSLRNDTLGKLLHNRRIIYAKEILGAYLNHFNFDFLFLTGDASSRHHASGMGMLYWWDAIFLTIGIVVMIRKNYKGKNTIFYWFAIAPMASAITKATPHAVRSLFYLPTYQIFIALGFLYFFRWIKTKFGKKGINFGLFILLLLVINFYYYLHMYFIHTPLEESKQWQYGYKQLVEKISTRSDYSKAIITYKYDQPYVYFLFYQKIDPVWYQDHWGSGEIQRANREFGNYIFRGIDWPKDSQLQNVIIVGTPKEIPASASGITDEIRFLDGSTAFYIIKK